MRLFKKHDAGNTVRHPVRFLLIVIALGLVFTVVGRVTRHPGRDEKRLLEAFDAWSELNAGRAAESRILVGLTPVDGYLTYVDSSYFSLSRRAEMLGDVAAFARKTRAERLDEIRHTEMWIGQIEALYDSLRAGTRAGLAQERERLEWYRELLDDAGEGTMARLFSEREAAAEAVRKMEESNGYKITYRCSYGDGHQYRMTFLAPEENPDSLILYGVTEE